MTSRIVASSSTTRIFAPLRGIAVIVTRPEALPPAAVQQAANGPYYPTRSSPGTVHPGHAACAAHPSFPDQLSRRILTGLLRVGRPDREALSGHSACERTPGQLPE